MMASILGPRVCAAKRMRTVALLVVLAGIVDVHGQEPHGRSAAHPPLALCSYRPDPNLADHLADLAAYIGSNPDALASIGPAQICLLYDRMRALPAASALRERCDFIPDAQALFRQLDACTWTRDGSNLPSAYLWPVLPKDSDLFGSLGIPMPEPDDQPMTEDDLILYLIGQLGADALRNPDVLLRLIEGRARLHLVNVLAHVPMTAAQLDPILPLFTSFWSDVTPLDWEFLYDVAGLRVRNDSATPIEAFWQIGAVRAHFQDRAPDLIEAVTQRLERFLLLEEISYPFLYEIFADVPQLLAQAAQYDNLDVLDLLLSLPQLHLDLQPFADRLTWADIDADRNVRRQTLLAILHAAAPSVWREAALAVLDRGLNAITPDYIESVLRAAIPALQPTELMAPYPGHLDVERQFEARFGGGRSLDELVVLAARTAPEFLRQVVNEADHADGYTLLHYAIRNAKADMLKALLPVPGLNMGAKNRYYRMAFDYYLSAFAGRKATVEVLVKQIETIRKFFANVPQGQARL